MRKVSRYPMRSTCSILVPRIHIRNTLVKYCVTFCQVLNWYEICKLLGRERVLFLTPISDMTPALYEGTTSREKILYDVYFKMTSLCQAFDIKAVTAQGKEWLNQHGGVLKDS